MIDVRPVLEVGVVPDSQAPDFEAFYEANRVRLFRALVVVTRDVDRADDLAQESFVKVWERWDRVGGMDDPAGYLYRVAMNGWFQVHRRAARAARRVVLPRDAVDPLQLVEDRDLVARRLLELPERQRAALVLTDYLGLGSDAAARRLGIRPGTVRRLASVARATLRRRSEEEADA